MPAGLIGQADLSDRRAIEQALRRTEQGVGDALVDLSELEFIDVGGVRQLIDHAAVLGIEGRSVRLTGVRPGIMRIFQICLSTRPPNLHPQRLGSAVWSAEQVLGRSGAGALL